MLVVAFILTALAGALIGIWLFARAANSQLPANPTHMWAFIDTVKKKTIEAYAEELIHGLELGNPEQCMTPEEVSVFIREYTSNVLDYPVTRR